MKLCDTCIYRNNVEQLKPCIIYRDDCEYYEKERGDMTNEQVKAEIMQIYGVLSPSKQQALDMAIEALEQEPSCPYYIIDEDGHGLCKNHRLEQEPILDKIRAEIECLTITKGGEDYIRKMAELYSLKIKVLQIIDKYKAESEDKE